MRATSVGILSWHTLDMVRGVNRLTQDRRGAPEGVTVVVRVVKGRRVLVEDKEVLVEGKVASGNVEMVKNTTKGKNSPTSQLSRSSNYLKIILNTREDIKP